jgi:hypothetical protein
MCVILILEAKDVHGLLSNVVYSIFQAATVN